MKVQQIESPETDKISWMVLDDDYTPVQPLESYIRYMEALGRSPNTVKNYAHHLKLYWEYLKDAGLDWNQVDLKDLAEFIYWLRNPEPGTSHIQQQEAKRSEATVNVIRSTVSAFYEYHRLLGTAGEIPLYKYQSQPRKYKDFLYHINKSKPVKNSRLKLKEKKKIPEVLTKKQVAQLIGACHTLRDKFLVQLLYETGMRIGQALGLRHEDIQTWDNEILVVPRNDNVNGARAKTYELNKLTVSPELMGLYTDYLVQELEKIISDYVFVNFSGEKVGRPMVYSGVISLFRSLSKRVGFKVHPHMFRHTHATELIRSGMGMEWVQKRLGHQSVQTTVNTYSHLAPEDLRPQLESFFERNKDK